MRSFAAVVERDRETGLYVGFVPGWNGAHSQAATLDELRDNLREVLEMLLEDDGAVAETDFIGIHQITVG
jgi:predicted RNase H-like HicB family nuclease